MALITVDEDAFALVQFHQNSKLTLRSGVAVTAGQIIIPDPSTGEWKLAAGDDAANAGPLRYIALKTVAAGGALTGARDCIVDLGASALDGLNFGTALYLDDEDSGPPVVRGILSTTSGDSTTTTIVGYVVPNFVGTTVNRLFQVL